MKVPQYASRPPLGSVSYISAIYLFVGLIAVSGFILASIFYFKKAGEQIAGEPPQVVATVPEPAQELLVAGEFHLLNQKVSAVTLGSFHGVLVWYTSPQIAKKPFTLLGSTIYDFWPTLNVESTTFDGTSKTIPVPPEGHAFSLVTTKEKESERRTIDYTYHPQIEVE